MTSTCQPWRSRKKNTAPGYSTIVARIYSRHYNFTVVLRPDANQVDRVSVDRRGAPLAESGKLQNFPPPEDTRGKGSVTRRPCGVTLRCDPHPILKEGEGTRRRGGGRSSSRERTHITISDTANPAVYLDHASRRSPRRPERTQWMQRDTHGNAHFLLSQPTRNSRETADPRCNSFFVCVRGYIGRVGWIVLRKKTVKQA